MSTTQGSDAAEARVVSRRDAIVGALALAAGALLAQKPETAHALDGQYVLVAGAYSAANATLIMRTFDGAIFSPAYSSVALTANTGLIHYGVDGQSFGGDPGSAGVFGHTAHAAHYGVLAQHAGAGTALKVEGKARFSRSGRASISKGAMTRTITGVANIGTDSLIMATLQGPAGTGVVIAYTQRISATSFRIVLNKAATRSALVAWFIIN
ncbi:MAG: hypothetical protein Q7W30_10590 [Coriobacteriia bacterium]|nr:hypothetical protein [Coriobacteriia bacterium]